jgi:two-component sensor histidine kinase
MSLEQAVPSGLIITELVSNALKHGYAGGRSGKITVELDQAEGQKLVLRVCDDGAGLPPGLDPATTPTLGLKLVSKLAGQLEGHLALERPYGAGASFSVIFPAPMSSQSGSES